MVNDVVKIVLLAVMLAGCGGSGGSGGTDQSEGDSVGIVQQSASHQLQTENAGGGAEETGLEDCSESEFAVEMLASINEYRAQARSCGDEKMPAVPALSWNCALASAAYGHSEDMALNNFFSHTGSDGLSVSYRVDNAGYEWLRVGENIAGGQSSIAQVMEEWMASPGHCLNIMNENYTEVGAALVIDNEAYYRRYWTQNFATPYDR